MPHNAFEDSSQIITQSTIVSADKTVINHLGENYYRVCAFPVHGNERCIKIEGHFSAIHESMDGVTTNIGGR